MKSWKLTCWTVARWEFFRYFKLRDQIIGLISLLFGGLIGFGAVSLARSASKVKLGVVGASESFEFPKKGHLHRVPEDHAEDEWRELIDLGKVDGLLKLTGLPDKPFSAELIVRKEPTWLDELKPVVQGEKLLWEVRESKIDPIAIERILTPSEIDIVTLVERDTSKGDRVVAFSMLGAMLITSWIGLAYMMTGLTGEKQQRVTEQIVSAIRPQAWIDGKLLGITAAAIGSLAFLMVTGIISIPAAWCFGIELTLPESLQRWDLVPVFLFFYLGGVLFWNCFYAAVASIINDPNTSSRSSLMFLPMLPMIAAGLVTSQPNGLMMQILSLLPGASATAMPIRLVLGDVSAIEIALSAALMVAGIYGMRLVAGRVFAATILLYGQEPSWIDVAKWALIRPADSKFSRSIASIAMLLSVSLLCNTATFAQDKSELKPEFDRPTQIDSFDTVWKTIKDVHWDSELAGAKWDKLRDEYRPQIEKAESIIEVRSLLGNMLSQLGQSHIGIIPSESYQILEEQANAGGEGVSGLTLRLVENQLVVTNVRNDSPAGQAGIEVGWVLKRVSKSRKEADESDANRHTLTSDEFMSRVRKGVEKQVTRYETAIGLAATGLATGGIGEVLDFTFLDNQDVQQTKSLTLVQGKGLPTKLGNLPLINVEFQSRLLPDDIGYISFNAFFDPYRLMKEFQNAIQQDYANSRGLVIDMRGNMGGMVLLTMGLSGWFVDEPKKLGTMHMKGAPLQVVINPRKPKFATPVAILIDECSISAAEIFAGGLQDNGVARVFGQRSAGLVLPSNVLKLPNRDGFQYVLADYTSESGRTLEGNGVVPNETIHLSRKSLQEEVDPVLAAAKRWILAEAK